LLQRRADMNSSVPVNPTVTPEVAATRLTWEERREMIGGVARRRSQEPQMMAASELLQQHFQTLVADNARWLTLIADDLLWELAYAPSLGHPARLSGRAEVIRHVSWFLGAVEDFRFFDLQVHPFADPEGAVAEVKAEGLIKATGRTYRQDYVLFLRAAGGKIAFLREYFDPVRAAKALGTPIHGLDS
jgi:ketosteroid isomerase-like protein